MCASDSVNVVVVGRECGSAGERCLTQWPCSLRHGEMSWGWSLSRAHSVTALVLGEDGADPEPGGADRDRSHHTHWIKLVKTSWSCAVNTDFLHLGW